jgi:hypothetical protein
VFLLLPFPRLGGVDAAGWILKFKFPIKGLICINRFDARQYARFSDPG